jgi:hypothetical protein
LVFGEEWCVVGKKTIGQIEDIYVRFEADQSLAVW